MHEVRELELFWIFTEIFLQITCMNEVNLMNIYCTNNTAQKVKLFIKDLFSKCDQIRKANISYALTHKYALIHTSKCVYQG